MKKHYKSLVTLIATLSLISSAAAAFGYPRDRYDNSYSDDQYDVEQERNELERERLDWEREKIRDEREQFEKERQNSRRPAQSVRETCPSGFTPSENKCSVQERRNGCKDMRLPGGLGCVKR